MRNRSHAVRQGEELISKCEEKNIGFIDMKPLAGGAIENGTLSTISFMGFRIRGNTFSSFFTIIQRLREIMEDNLKHLLRKSGGAFAPPEV